MSPIRRSGRRANKVAKPAPFCRADANPPPIATIRGGNTRLEWPEGIALDASGKIYVANSGFAPDFAGSITVYATGADGHVAPFATISGAKTGLRDCSAIALDPSGRIYVANGGGKFPGSVNVYPAGGHGDIAPIAIIGGPKTKLSSPAGIALDSKGRIYVVNPSKLPSSSSIQVYAAGSNGDAAPIATISGDQTELGNPQGVALDSNDDIYSQTMVWFR